MDLPAPTPRLTPVQVAFAVPATMLLLATVFAPVPVVLHGATVTATLDFSHFLLAAVACWFLSARLRWDRWAAFATVVAAAAACEIVQAFTGRRPSAIDFFRGLLGASAALIWLSAFRPSATSGRWIGVSVVVVAISAWPVSEFLFATARFCIRVAS